MRLISIVFLIVFSSCKTEIFVAKSKIVKETQGFLLFYHSDKSLFIPSRDTSIDFFFSNIEKLHGYLLGPTCGVNDRKIFAREYDVNLVYLENGKEYLLPEKIAISTVRFMYLQNRSKEMSIDDSIEFELNKIRYEIKASDHFSGEVLKIESSSM